MHVDKPLTKESVCIKVPKNHGETAIVQANRLRLIDHELEIKKDARFVYIPLLNKPSNTTLQRLKDCVPDLEISTDIFAHTEKHHEILTEVLEDKLPPHLIASLPHSADIIGEIAIVEIPTELKPHEKAIGDAILKTHKNVRTVLAKAGPISGTYRLREFSVIAGEPKTATVHKENGCRFYVDVAKAYFSPRLSHEHDRVASLVNEGETVIDLFAGVGPFAVQIAKKIENVKVYAVDVNPEAIEFLKRNTRLNRVESRVIPVLGDAREAILRRLLGVADRVIMNLPEKAIEFVDVACKAIKPQGGTIHLYCFINASDSLEEFLRRFEKLVEKYGRKSVSTPSATYVRDTAPYERQVVLDARVR
jgi:tRNA (guanine37-N1)-methyltransferase